MNAQQDQPYSIESERAVIGSILVEPFTIEAVAAIITPRDFFIVRHGWIFDAILSLRKQHKQVDYVTLCDELSARGQLVEIGGPAYITELEGAVPSAFHAESYARIIRADSVRRDKINNCSRIVQMAYDRTVPAEDLSAESIRLMLEGERLNGRTARASDIASELFDQVQEWANNPLRPGQVRGLSVGLRAMDKAIGGLDSDTLTIVAGRPGMGKSALVFQIAENVAVQGKHVAVFSLEMNRKMFLARLACGRAGVNWLKIKQGCANPDDLARFMNELGELSTLPIVINDTPNQSIAQVRAAVATLHAQHPLGLVVLDHIGLVFDRESNQVIKLHNVAWGLKSIAKDFHIPTIGVAQLSRGVESREDKRPTLADLRESGRIEEDADIVVMLYRDKYYDHNLKTDVAEAWIRKNRDGQTNAKAEMSFKEENTRFWPLAEEIVR